MNKNCKGCTSLNRNNMFCLLVLNSNDIVCVCQSCLVKPMCRKGCKPYSDSLNNFWGTYKLESETVVKLK